MIDKFQSDKAPLRHRSLDCYSFVFDTRNFSSPFDRQTWTVVIRYEDGRLHEQLKKPNDYYWKKRSNRMNPVLKFIYDFTSLNRKNHSAPVFSFLSLSLFVQVWFFSFLTKQIRMRLRSLLLNWTATHNAKLCCVDKFCVLFVVIRYGWDRNVWSSLDRGKWLWFQCDRCMISRYDYGTQANLVMANCLLNNNCN